MYIYIIILYVSLNAYKNIDIIKYQNITKPFILMQMIILYNLLNVYNASYFV